MPDDQAERIREFKQRLEAIDRDLERLRDLLNSNEPIDWDAVRDAIQAIVMAKYDAIAGLGPLAPDLSFLNVYLELFLIDLHAWYAAWDIRDAAVADDRIREAEDAKRRLLLQFPPFGGRAFEWWYQRLADLDRWLDDLRDLVRVAPGRPDEVLALLEWLKGYKEGFEETVGELQRETRSEAVGDIHFPSVLRVLILINQKLAQAREAAENADWVTVRRLADAMTSDKAELMRFLPQKVFGHPFGDWYKRLYLLNRDLSRALSTSGQQEEWRARWARAAQEAKRRLADLYPDYGGRPFRWWYDHLSAVDDALEGALRRARREHPSRFEVAMELRRAIERKTELEVRLSLD